MKSTHGVYIPKEDEKKFVSVGGRFGAAAQYTKSDYLTPGKVAEKFGISIEKAKNIMKDLIFKRASFALNAHKAPIVTKMGKSGECMYLHPLALEAFQKYIDPQKD